MSSSRFGSALRRAASSISPYVFAAAIGVALMFLLADSPACAAPSERVRAAPTRSTAPASARVARAERQRLIRGDGLAATFSIGGSRALGDGSEQYDAGFPIGVSASYQVNLGRFTVAPQFIFEMSRWAASDADARGMMVAVGGGGELAYWLQHVPIGLWTSLALAYADNSVAGADIQSSKSGLAMRVGWGVNYMMTSYVGAGLFMGVTRSFASGDAPTGAFNFGFRLRAFYALGGG